MGNKVVIVEDWKFLKIIWLEGWAFYYLVIDLFEKNDFLLEKFEKYQELMFFYIEWEVRIYFFMLLEKYFE